MQASGKSPRQPRRPRGPGEARVPQPPPPLVRRDVIARIGEALARAGAGELGEALIGEVDRHAHYLERCAVEAEAVLRGRIEAATRLWLLLREPIPAGSAIPPAVLGRIGGDSLREPPAVLGGDPLLRLVAGAVRAAGRPALAEAMLDALGRLLEPFFLLDLAGVAATQAGHGYREPLETLIVAWGAPRWAPPPPPPPPGGPRPPPDRSGPAVIQPINPPLGPFEAAVTSTIGSWISRWPCLGSTGLKMSTYHLLDPQYAIESIDKPQACPGDTIRISGHDFGPEGLVAFEPPPPTDPVAKLHAGDPGLLAGVKAKRWTDTEIDVVVPAWAIAGGVHLNTFKIEKNLCATIYVYRLGNSFPFEGGLATIEKVTIGTTVVDLDSTKPVTITPGSTVVIAWKSNGSSAASVALALLEGVTVLWKQTGLPAAGSTSLKVPDANPRRPRLARLAFAMSGPCGATAPLEVPVYLSAPPILEIEFIEVTQGVQRDLEEVAGGAMPMVAWKDTAVRIHMSCRRTGWFYTKVDKITGTLLVDGKLVVPINDDPGLGKRYASFNGLSNPQETNQTLNFRIPAAWLSPGAHTLIAQLVFQDPGGRVTVSRQIPWTWVEKAPLQVRALYIGQKPTPTDEARMRLYLRDALDYLPFPLTGIGMASLGWLGNNENLSTEEGWNNLLAQVGKARFLDSLEAGWMGGEISGPIWLGIIPTGTAKNPPYGGLATVGGIAGIALEARPISGAHELGHCLGLDHINLPMGVPKGPYQWADNGGFLRRPPFDVRRGVAIRLTAGDLMSYLSTRWTGVSTWTRLFNSD